MDEKDTRELVKQVSEKINECKREEEHKSSMKSLGAIGFVLPWLLACIFIMLLVCLLLTSPSPRDRG